MTVYKPDRKKVVLRKTTIQGDTAPFKCCACCQPPKIIVSAGRPNHSVQLGYPKKIRQYLPFDKPLEYLHINREKRFVVLSECPREGLSSRLLHLGRPADSPFRPKTEPDHIRIGKSFFQDSLMAFLTIESLKHHTIF